ncbi:MAG: CPXCG motif-containing cysteine-rich protein [Alcanivoracaceae bacterium]|nr:CPXCG motif-containing cysteine-rich protein [Alcanivoracaceae bacterium]
MISCPYCGEAFTVLVDCSAGDQQYIEDCQVCCRPMVLAVHLDEQGRPAVEPRRDDE